MQSISIYLALVAVLLASVQAQRAPAAALARATNVPGSSPGESRNLQTWKQVVNGCEAPPVVRKQNEQRYRIVVPPKDQQQLAGNAQVRAQFEQLRQALTVSCNTFQQLCETAARLVNQDTQACTTAQESCLASIPRSESLESVIAPPVQTTTLSSAGAAAPTNDLVSSSEAAARPTQVIGRGRGQRDTPQPTQSAGAGRGGRRPGRGGRPATSTRDAGAQPTNNVGNGGNNNAGDNGGAAGNLQTFTGAILGIRAPQVRNVGGSRPFQVIVNGQVNGDFVKLAAALERSCAVQNNQCSNAINSGRGRAQGLRNIQVCQQQQAQCNEAASGAGNGGNQGSNNGGSGNNGRNQGGNNGGNFGRGNDGRNRGNNGRNQGGKNGGNAGGNQGGSNGRNSDNPIPGLNNGASFCNAVGLGGAIADGTQKRTATCSATVQGAIPAFDRMVSTIIVTPESGARIPRGQDVEVTVRTLNMDLGFFEDPNSRYYASPQTLNSRGVVEGHQHVTVQRLGNSQTPPDPRTEALLFFKGLDQEDNNTGILTVTIPGASLNQRGIVRICTMTGTRGHQPVLMPVARRGAQDDCIRITVV